MGRGEAGGFTVPAINVRGWPTTRPARWSGPPRQNCGAFIFELARSEMGYTEQRPTSTRPSSPPPRSARGTSGPIFIQGDHYQANAKRYKRPTPRRRSTGCATLIREAIAAGYCNIDIDTSTLVTSQGRRSTSSRPTTARCAPTSRRTSARTSRRASPSRSAARSARSAGKNSTVEELQAYHERLQRHCRAAALVGLSKVSVQTGTATAASSAGRHDPPEVKHRLRDAAKSCRGRAREYGLGGAVQHGASTLPPEAFDAFPKVGALEIHLATGFQNMVYEHPPSRRR